MSLQKLSEIRTDHIDAISSLTGAPAWLAEYRRQSLATYHALPLETSPLYNKYTDAKRLDPAQVLLQQSHDDDDDDDDDDDVSQQQSLPSILTRRLSELQNSAAIIQVGRTITHVHTPDAMAELGVIICPVLDALCKNDGSADAAAAKAALESTNSNDDKFTALNNAAFDSGVLVHIPDNIQLKDPIHLIVCLPPDGTSVISRNIISVGDSARATIVQELYSPPSQGQPAYMELLNTSCGANSHLDVTTLQMLDQSAANFSTRMTALGADARVNWYSGLFGSMLSRYRIDYFLRGSGATANDSEVVFGNAEQSFDIQTNVNHESPATEGRVVEKSILRDKSRSLFKGMIRIKENAAKSNSFLSGRSILLDPDAKSDAIPGLEIFTNDVKATHSASVAQIDEEQIFYLQSRCLSREEAERTIVEGFLEPLSRKMSYQVRAWIAYLIESKWDGRELGINTDAELAKFVEVEETRYNEDAEIEQHYKYR